MFLEILTDLGGKCSYKTSFVHLFHIFYTIDYTIPTTTTPPPTDYCTDSSQCEITSGIAAFKSFCNFDYNYSGFCEPCYNFPNPETDCNGFINDKGIYECKRVCGGRYLYYLF